MMAKLYLTLAAAGRSASRQTKSAARWGDDDRTVDGIRFITCHPAQVQEIMSRDTAAGHVVVCIVAIAVVAAAASAAQNWSKVVEIDPTGIKTEEQFMGVLKQKGLTGNEYVNYFVGRWPSISFIGGSCMGDVPEDLEFFYDKPFRYSNRVLDFVMEGGGKVYGIRAKIRRYKEGGRAKAMRSFLLRVRCDVLLNEYHPSYILANGRRIWDSKKHPWQQGKIMVPFSLAEATDPVIDLVVDERYTPEIKGLAFRMFFVMYLGESGVKVDLKGAGEVAEGSPGDRLERFAFGLFPARYDFWADRGVSFAQVRKDWKANFRPEYAVDDLWLSPFVFDSAGEGKYHDFMVRYGGCNVLGARPSAQSIAEGGARVRGALCSMNDVEGTKALLGAGLEAHWFGGEEGVMAAESVAEHARRMEAGRSVIERAKHATGRPERIKAVYEPFSPALTCAHEYERGHDILVLKNEEDPQYNIMMSMGRGAGRTFGRPFGFYWEQTHYPYVSLDFKLQACLLYYLCGGSWIGAEAENFPAFEREMVAEPALPYMQALRFAMVHPARGAPIVPIGILWTQGDRWPAPYNPLGHLDTFLRYIKYDHATKAITTESYATIQPWMPAERSRWSYENSGHMRYLYDSVPELRGYDLLDVFFPRYGDAFSARLTRLLTGTPYGPVDFIYGNQATAAHLKSFGLIAILGHANVTRELEGKLRAAVESGSSLVMGAQHFKTDWRNWGRAFGLEVTASDVMNVEGRVVGSGTMYQSDRLRFSGRVYGFKGEGWETVGSVGGRALVVRKTTGQGAVWVYLGELVGEGGDALRPVLAALAREAAPVGMEPADDQIEYVAYRKGNGAWVAVFNHGNIAIGCDRLKELRATPPEPLVSKPKGAYRGQIAFRLGRLKLDPNAQFALYEVSGIDGQAFEEVISGHKSFMVNEIPSQRESGVIRATVKIDKRAQYVVAPKGEGQGVFFGKP